MSQIDYSANLSSDDIPLISAHKNRTVIVGKIDQDYTLDSGGTRLQKEKNVPECLFAQNIMPTGRGYQSVGFVQKIAKHPSAQDFRGAYVLRDQEEDKAFYSPANGKNYIWDRNFNQWRSINPIVGAETALVTVAYLNGETYIFYEKIGCFLYNRVTQTLDSVTLTGLVIANINGICAAQGFLLAWDDLNFIYRSQAAAPLDFTPDPSLGSGAGIPEDIKGKIVVLLPISNGYIVYTTANAVGAVFQQNIRYPFIYREVDGSAGIVSPDHVSWTDNLGDHYAWTISGLQKVNKSKATPVFPAVTDFLVAKLFEDYDTATNNFTVTKLSTQLSVNVRVLGSRFVVISYGVSDSLFTHAIVHDIALKRFGKVKIDHVAAFFYVVPNLSGDITWDMLDGLSWDDLGVTTWADLGTQLITQETPKEFFAFLGMDGQVRIVNFDLVQNGNDAVAMFGKYQYVRERLLALDSVDIENVDALANFELQDWVSINGKTTKYKNVMYPALVADNIRKFLAIKPNVGINHILVAKGTFDANLLQLVFHADARR